MNIVAIVVLVIIGLCVWRGYNRGLFQTVLVAGATILAIVAANYATPYVSATLQKLTPLDEKVEEYIIHTLDIDVLQNDTSKNEEMTLIDELPIPDALKMALINNNNEDAYSKLNVSGFYEYVAHYLAQIVLNCIAFVLIQLAITIALMILIYTSQILTEIPILNGIDKGGGIVLGILQALAIIWSAFIFISIIGNTPLGINIYAQITDNRLLSFLYDNNLILHTITNIAKML